MNPETKNCQNCKKDFVIESEDFDFYEKIDVPSPTWCPNCRLQRRMAFRNERTLYHRKCDLCNDKIIAMYSPDKPFKVYCPACFYSDKWDSLEFGRDYDKERNFFEQWQELQKKVPQLSLWQENVINSPWINYELDAKNCYLNFGGQYNEDSAYNQYALTSKDCFDTFWSMGAQFVYETTLAKNSYKVFYSKLCYDCRDTWFSFDCRNCSNIIGCTGLRHKQYQIFNKPVRKEEFGQFLEDNTGSRNKTSALKARVLEFWKSRPQRACFVDKSVNSTGNLLKECKNCKECWNTEKTEDSKWQLYSLEGQDAYDVFSVWRGQRCYELLAGEHVSNVKFTVGALRETSSCEYCSFVMTCHDCFGCINLRNKKYCILNKQYSKEDYFKLKDKIIQDMKKNPYVDQRGRVYKYGEFFPYALSPFGYNETVAREYFPLPSKDIKKAGFKFSSYESKKIESEPYNVPDKVVEVKDEILKKVLICKTSKKPYRLIPMELSFYRRFNLSIPENSPFERHQQRLNFISSHIRLLDRICGKCGKNIKSVYPKKEFSTIYCDDCYYNEVV